MKILDKRSIRAFRTICCMICMMMLLCTAPQYVYAQKSAEIETISTTAEKGGSAWITLNLTNNPGIWGMKFKVGYNHDAMTLKAVSIGNIFTKGEVTLPENYNKENFVFYATGDEIKNNTKTGKLLVLEFKLSENATAADYPISLELIQCINVDGDDVAVKMTNGKVIVTSCMHSEKEWKVTKAATCESKGSETQSCKKCGKVFDTREIKALEHKNTVLKDVIQATESKEGYTGDTYCKDCNKLLEKGTVVEKIEKPAPEESESEEETEDDEKDDKEPVFPWGGVLAVLFIAILLGALVFVYMMFIQNGKMGTSNKKGRLNKKGKFTNGKFMK